MIRYVALGRLIIDDLVLADGTEVTGVLGGAGLYAAVGAALADGRTAGLVSGVGRDLDQAELARWDVSAAALTVAGAVTTRSRVVYRADGERIETPSFGLEHFAAMAPRVTAIPAAWRDVRGVYLFAGTDPGDWQGVPGYARGRVLLWEISADACAPDRFDEVAARLGDVDLFSINLAEAGQLCGTADPAACVATLTKAGAARVVVRMGAAGALLGDGSGILHVGAAPGGPVVDPTGAGNCHSGALLVGFGETGDLARAGRCAAAAASLAIEQYGPPGPVPPGLLDQRAELTTAESL